MDFWDYINNGEKYYCDKCNVVVLREDEYTNNQKFPYHYCDECFNFIKLQKWKCNKCKSSGSVRSERKLNLVHCGELIVCQ